MEQFTEQALETMDLIRTPTNKELYDEVLRRSEKCLQMNQRHYNHCIRPLGHDGPHACYPRDHWEIWFA